MKENLLEIKKCHECNSVFYITDKDIEFLNKISPIFNGHKFELPTSDLCPICREQTRLLWRNERKLYKRKCDATWQPIISVYAPNEILAKHLKHNPYKVYNQDFWWSDKWDAISYEKDFNFTKPFFEQFKELFIEIPQQNLIWSNNENSPYCHLVADNKNCYLITESSNNEDCFYGYWLQKCRDCVDCSFVHWCEKCYESNNCINCYNSNYLSNCVNCKESYLLNECIWCSYCFACTNLINKEYYIFNEQYSKEEYFKKIENFKNDPEIFNKFANLSTQSIKKACNIINSVNSTWNHITNSKNCKNVLQAHDAEDCRYCENVWRGAKDCMDSNTAWRSAELVYYSLNCWINVHNLIFCNQCWECSDMIYCSNCSWSKNCFWSVWLVNKQYCILNKQYTKEEYELKVWKIIEHMQGTKEWWLFFPTNISPFWYNETVAQEYYKLSKNEALKKWFNWLDYEIPFPKVDKIIPAAKLPKNILNIPDDILNWAIECEESKKPFRIIAQELEFYRKQDLPIPKRHPDIRHLNRIKIWNPRKLFDRKCDKCLTNILSIYSIEKPEIIYCEECYNKEIY